MHHTSGAFLLVLILQFISVANGLVHAVDSSSLVSVATFQKAMGEGFSKAIIRGYQNACSSGGQVDPNFVSTYNNARAAGYTDIDVYWFPCTGTNNPCKSFEDQISELSSAFDAHKMKINRIWVDIERDPECNNWNYGASSNLNMAKKLVNAIRASGFSFGIYSSPGEWGSIFGSQNVVLDNSLPLWFATYNNVETLALNTPFGGWSTAFGHQYTDQSASGQFDLSVFAN